MRSHHSFAILLLAAVALVSGCSGGGDDVAGPDYTVRVIMAGAGAGRVYSDGNWVDCPSNCGPLDWTGGATVNLVAEPELDSVFVSWTGACTGVDPQVCTFVVTGHMEVTATFNKL